MHEPGASYGNSESTFWHDLVHFSGIRWEQYMLGCQNLA